MKVLITGSNGFVGKNLQVRLAEEEIEFDTFTRDDSITSLEEKLSACDALVHLAGVNRPKNEQEFVEANTELTQLICDIIKKNSFTMPVVYTSSIQAELDNAYGLSKRNAEKAFVELTESNGNLVLNYRLPNVFGKWCKPNYNSAVATFCYNIINELPITINDPDAVIKLVYIDDVVSEFVSVIKSFKTSNPHTSPVISPIYQITVGDLVGQLKRFKESKTSGILERVGKGFTRALYSTYISYYKSSEFTYPLVKHEDPRGAFVEVIKSKDSGQFSYFIAHPGVTRGGHYHHSKTEKFLVINGQAHFRFKNIITGEFYECFTSGDRPEIVETIPGWAHDITNMGNDELICMLWANEIFDVENPDTVSFKVSE